MLTQMFFFSFPVFLFIFYFCAGLSEVLCSPTSLLINPNQFIAGEYIEIDYKSKALAAAATSSSSHSMEFSTFNKK